VAGEPGAFYRRHGSYIEYLERRYKDTGNQSNGLHRIGSYQGSVCTSYRVRGLAVAEGGYNIAKTEICLETAVAGKVPFE
jgi:hypothetical protein